MKKFPKKISIILTIAIIGVIGFSITASAANSSVPDWVKNNAKWWSEGSITETDYIKSLEFLITQGIIQIPIPITEVTAAQSLLSDDERAQYFVVHFSDGLIEKPITVETFYKFEATSSRNLIETAGSFSIYEFDDKPIFLLESMPSPDKQDLYRGIDDWMDRGQSLTPFDVSVDVLSGDGRLIQTWAYDDCQPTAYGTYLQDSKLYYQFVENDVPEIRERIIFSCQGIDLEVPEI